MKNLVFLILLLALTISDLSADNAKIEVTNDTNNVLIGKPIKLNLSFKSDEEVKVIWPSLPDTLSKLEILNISKIDTFKKDNSFELKQTISITCFEPDTVEIPSLDFIYKKNKLDEPKILPSNIFSLQFVTVEVDTTEAILDIKSPLDVESSIWDYFWYILIPLLALIGAFIAYFIWSKTKTKEKVKDLGYDPKIPAHILALQALKQVEEEKLWQNDQVKLYFVKTSDIFRTYIQRRYNFNAMEMISEEIIKELKDRSIATEDIEKAFGISDLAKFAKHKPLADENQKVLDIYRSFIEKTKEVVKTPEDKNG